jgi:D-ribulokinase
MHVVPEFLGNRAPHANPPAKAAIVGIGLDKSEESLVGLYVAGLLGLGYGLRQIIEASAVQGIDVGSIFISGGAGKSRLVRQLIADASGRPVVTTASAEPVLLGSAMLAATAAGVYPSLVEAMSAMSSVAEIATPDDNMASFHERRFDAFGKLQLLTEDIRRCA